MNKITASKIKNIHWCGDQINLLSLWFIRIIPAFVLGYYFENILFVYIAMISDTFVKALFLYREFNKGKWKKIKV